MILHWFRKIAHFDIDFTAVGVVLSSAEFLAFTTFLPLKHTQKRRKSANTGGPFSKNQETAATTSSELRSFLPKTVKFAKDRGKRVRVSAHRRGAGVKIVFLNEYARDLVVCHIVPGKLLLPQISIVRFVGLLFSWHCSASFELLEQLETVVTRAQFNAIDQRKPAQVD